jgi:hypothetical protein
VDDYIVKFKNLLSKVEWGWDQHGTIAAFKEGLVERLLGACIRWCPCPVMLSDWEDAARDEEQSFYQLKFDLAEARRHRMGRHLGDMAWDASKSKKPAYNVDPCPHDPMQLDAAWIQKLTDEECQKLLKEKKSFYCKKMGHMFVNCKERPKSKGKGKGRMKRHHLGPRARAASATSDLQEESKEEEEVEKDKKVKDAPPIYTKKNLMAAIKKLSVDEREDLMETMALKSDQDFWNAQCHWPGCRQYVHAECTLSKWIWSIYVFLYKLRMQWPNKLPSWTVEQQKTSSATIPGNNWGLDDRNSMNPSQYTMSMEQKTRKARLCTTASCECYMMDSSDSRSRSSLWHH